MPALAAIGSLLVFGASVAFIIACGKLLVGQSGWPPFLLSGLQNCSAAAVVFLAAFITRAPCRTVLKHIPFFAISASFGIAIPQVIAFLVAPHLGAAVTSITYLFPPLLTFVFALFFQMEQLDVMGAMSLSLGAFGGALLFVGQSLQPSMSLSWLAIALAAPVFQALGNIYRSKFWPSGIAILPFTAMILFMTGLMGLIFSAALGDVVVPAELPPRDIGLITACALAAAAGYCVFFYLQRLAGPVYVSQGGFVIAGFGALAGTLAFGERLPVTAVVGAGIVAIGIVLFTWRARRSAQLGSGPQPSD